MKKKPLIEYILVGMNVAIGIVICVFYTLQINIDTRINHFDSWLVLILLWWLTVLLIGSSLSVCSLFISHITAIINKDSKTYEKGYLPPGCETGFSSAFWSIGISTAYTMVLYFWGLTDTFFSLMSFYI